MYTYVYIIHGYAKPIIIRSHHNGESVRKSPSYRNHRLCIYLYLERALRGDNFRKALHTYTENRNLSLEKRNVLKLSAPSIDLFLLLRNRACPRGRWARKVEKQIYIRAGIERRLHSEASYVALLPRRKKNVWGFVCSSLRCVYAMSHRCALRRGIWILFIWNCETLWRGKLTWPEIVFTRKVFCRLHNFTSW